MGSGCRGRRSIAEIQTALTGATDATLERTAHPEGPALGADVAAVGALLDDTSLSEEARHAAGHPNGATPEAADLLDGSAAGSGGPRGRFWAESPTDGTGPALSHPRPSAASPLGAATPASALRPVDPPPPSDTGRPARVTRPGGALVCGVRLADGVTLVLDGAGRTPAEDDIQAVLAAAAPLLALLEERKLA